jgi:hypothetical protein
VLQPGERAVAPVERDVNCPKGCFDRFIHPGVPAELAVMPGAYEGGEKMTNAVVENELPLPLQLFEGADLVVALQEGEVATAVTLSEVIGFIPGLIGMGAGKTLRAESWVAGQGEASS